MNRRHVVLSEGLEWCFRCKDNPVRKGLGPCWDCKQASRRERPGHRDYDHWEDKHEHDPQAKRDVMGGKIL